MRYLPLLLTLLIACGPSQDRPEGQDKEGTEKLGSVPVDTNKDGKPDSWYYEKTVEGQIVIVKKEIDQNFDGRIDIERFYDDEGQLTRDTVDMDFDGKIDVSGFYEGGKLVRKEKDKGHDGTPDLFRHYKDGVLLRLEADTDDDGVIDYWEYYKNGALTRSGSDEDGDGQPDPDKWEQAGG